MKYHIDTEAAKQVAARKRQQEFVSLGIGYAGMSASVTGAMGAVILRLIDNNNIPSSCLLVIAIGFCLFGVGKLIFPKQSMASAFLTAAKEGKILEISCLPKSPEPNYALITMLIETPSGECQYHHIGYARTCVHTGYNERMLDLNDECIYCPYPPVKP